MANLARVFAILLIGLLAAGCGAGANSAGPGPAAPTPLFTLPADVVVSAPSPETVWALANGSFLFLSTDRGVTWARRTLPAGHALDISFASEREGWAAYFDGAHTLTFWATADGGGSWRVARTIADLQPDESPGRVTLLGAQHALFSTQMDGRSVAVFRTADGGATWARSAPLPVTAPVGRIVASGAVLVAPAGSAVIRSADGGATWAVAGSTPDGRPVVAVGSDQHWVEAPYGVGTDDGGRTWHPWPASYQQAAGVAPEVVFAGAGVVYVTVRGTIQRSDDDGATWRTLSTPGA